MLNMFVIFMGMGLWLRPPKLRLDSGAFLRRPPSVISLIRFIHSSNHIPCSSNAVCVLFICLAILQIEGCLNSTLLTVFLESPTPACSKPTQAGPSRVPYICVCILYIYIYIYIYYIYIYVHMYICTYVCVCIYKLHINPGQTLPGLRAQPPARDGEQSLRVSAPLVAIYMYIFTHMYVHTHICIHV